MQPQDDGIQNQPPDHSTWHSTSTEVNPGMPPVYSEPVVPRAAYYGYGQDSTVTSRHGGIAPKVVAGIAALSLVLGGAAGAGAGAFMAHNQDNTAASSVVLSPSPALSNERVITGDVSQLTIKVVQQVGPAVVSIVNSLAAQSDVFGNSSQGISAGSGIIIDSNGYILTNYHVIAQEQNLKVTFANGTSTSATVVGGDPTNDIAVIKVDTKVPAIAQFGDSAALQPGETVIAIGNALGNLQNTVTEGVVSGLNRTLPSTNGSGTNTLQNLIQTSAQINHGNSGGPLLDLTGHVIGINTAVVRSTSSNGLSSGTDQAEGLGFAIPSNTAKAVADRIIFHTPSPFLGIEYKPVSAQIASAYNLSVGAYVLSVTPNSPAGKAGLKPEDVITMLGNQQINDQHDLKAVLDTLHIGETVQVKVLRSGQALTLTVVLGKH